MNILDELDQREHTYNPNLCVWTDESIKLFIAGDKPGTIGKYGPNQYMVYKNGVDELIRKILTLEELEELIPRWRANTFLSGL